MPRQTPPRSRPGPRTAESAALAAVLVVAWLHALLAGGAATVMYRHYAPQGDPPLAAIRLPGPDPAPATTPPGGPVSMLGHTGYFWSERAFHYRTTLALADDAAGARIDLARDKAQQHPTGVNQWREYTLLMEPVYAFCYRLAGDPNRPLVEFLLWFVPLVHVLLLPGLYAAARAVGAARTTALAAVVLWATTHVVFIRLMNSLLLKETFALTLLMGFVAAHLWAWRGGRSWLLAVAAVGLVPVLAGWHLAQFLVAVILGATAVARLAAGAPAGRRDLAMPAAYLLAMLAAALTPSLGERAFLISPPVLLVVAWLGAEILALQVPRLGSRAASRLGVLVLLAAVGMAGAVAVNRAYGGDYGHVTGLLLHKLRLGLAHPADPGELPFAVRVFWVKPFHTPGWNELRTAVGWHGPLLLLGLGTAVVAALRPATPAPRRALLLTVPVFAAGWLLVERLGVVFLPFGAVAAVLGLAGLVGDRWSPGRRAAVVLGVVAVAAAANLSTVLADRVGMVRELHAGRPVVVRTRDDHRAAFATELYRWVIRATPGPGSTLAGPPAAFLGDVAQSNQLLLYTARPVVMNSQFENVEVRDRYQAWLETLFGHEPQRLWELARGWQADYIFLARKIALADEPTSTSYLAGVNGRLDAGMTALRLHFDPTGVPGFAPVFDNEYYRVFRVLAPGESGRDHAWEGRGGAWWRRENFTIQDGVLVDPARDRERLLAIEKHLGRLQDEQQGILAADARRARNRPPLPALHHQLATLRFAAATGATTSAPPGTAGRIENAIRAALSEVDPGSGLSVAVALTRMSQGGNARPGWRQLLAGYAADPGHRAVAAQVEVLRGEYAAAAELLLAAAADWDPDRFTTGPVPEYGIQLREEALFWLVAAGRTAAARDHARRWLAGTPPAPGVGERVRILAATRPDSP